MEEIWRDIEGYEGLYQVSNLGRVRSLDRIVQQLNRWGKYQSRSYPGCVLNPGVTHDNYQSVSLTRQGKSASYSVHRLVAQAFIPNPDNLPQVNHKDENLSNNCVDNLEWCTAKYNSNYGTRIDKLRQSLTGIERTEEYKNYMSETRKGEGNPMYGRKQSEETKQKIKEALTGIKRSREYVEKMRERMKGNIPWNKGLHTRPVVCLDANIRFDCAEDAAEWVGGVAPEAIEYALDRIACCKGHVFVHADNIPEDIQSHIEQCIAKYRKSFTPCRCVEDNKVFRTISEAARFYNVSNSIVDGKIKSGRDVNLADGRIVHFERVSHEEFESLKCKESS